MVLNIKYPLETVEELKQLFPNNVELHDALDNNSSVAWDIVSIELNRLSNLFKSISMAGFPGIDA